MVIQKEGLHQLIESFRKTLSGVTDAYDEEGRRIPTHSPRALPRRRPPHGLSVLALGKERDPLGREVVRMLHPNPSGAVQVDFPDQFRV